MVDLINQKENSPERKIQREKWERCNSECKGRTNWTKCLKQCAIECKWTDRCAWRGEIKGIAEW